MSAKPGRARARKFYRVARDFKGKLMGLELENLGTLVPDQHILSPPTGRRGFVDFPEAPRFRLNKTRGGLPRDVEVFHDYWLVSNQAKVVLESVDPDGFAFVRCEVWLPHGLADPPYWLCDVVRALEAVDENTSQVVIEYDKATDRKYCKPIGDRQLVIKEDVVGSAHVFRLAYAEAWIFCDQELKDACKVARLKGVRFPEELRL